MKKIILLLMVSFSFALTACGQEEAALRESVEIPVGDFLNVSSKDTPPDTPPQYVVTYKSLNANLPDIVKVYEKGSRIEGLEKSDMPNGYKDVLYSLTNEKYYYGSSWSMNTWSLGTVESDMTVYCRWMGDDIDFCCIIDGYIFGKAQVNYDGYIKELPSEGRNVIADVVYADQTTILETSTYSIEQYMPGYEFEGWYYDEDFTKKVELPIHLTKNQNFYVYGKRGEVKEYNVDIVYRYPILYEKTSEPFYNNNGKFDAYGEKLTVHEEHVRLPYDFDLGSKLKQLPSEFGEWEIISYKEDVLAISENGKLTDTENLGWVEANDLQIDIYVKPIYAGYFEVRSQKNSELDGKLLPYDSISLLGFTSFEKETREAAANEIRATRVYGSDDIVTFKLSDIEEIKFKNGAEVTNFLAYNGPCHLYFPNLRRIDLSEMLFITRIPDYFFCGAESIEEVYAPSLPNLTSIGESFLGYNKIDKFEFDFSNVQSVGGGFLTFAFDGNGRIDIDLSQMKSFYSRGLNSGFLVNTCDKEFFVSLGEYIDVSEKFFSTYQNTKEGTVHFDNPFVATSSITIYSKNPAFLKEKLYKMENIKVEKY